MIEKKRASTPPPFLKWAGGKRWFCENHLSEVPPFSGRYIEPFLGSAALYFSLRPKSAILSDLNAELVATYRAVKSDPHEVARRLRVHHELHGKNHYYTTRARKPSDDVELASWFIYLNRTCWNGLYRVNKRNEFNVPIGTKTGVVLATDDFVSVSEMLRMSEIVHADFEATVDRAEFGDFVFIDPPYTVKHNLNGFVKYNDQIFSWADQERLRDAVVRASARGALVMVLNANHHSIRELYADVGFQTPLRRASVLAGNAAYRSQVEELMIRTWIAP